MTDAARPSAGGGPKPKAGKRGKTIVIYSQSDLGRDPRVHRQIELLSGNYRVIAFGKKPPSLPVDRFHDLTELIGIPKGKRISPTFLAAYVRDFGLARFFATAVMYLLDTVPAFPRLNEFWHTRVARGGALRRLRDVPCDLIIANDLTALGVCGAAKGDRKLLYDAHEYSPGQFPRDFRHLNKRVHSRHMLRKHLPACDSVSTVGDGAAGLYKRVFGVSCAVITNAPGYHDIHPVDRGDGRIRLVHHGIAARKRDLERLIDVMRLLDDRFTLDFFLLSPNPRYYAELKAYAADDPRITFNEPVAMQTLPEVLNDYDVGFWLYKPATLNLAHALPNKFFEFVQARLAVAIGPTPEMARYTRHYGFGVVSEDFTPESMARALLALTPERIMEYKIRAHQCAMELSAEPNNRKILALVEGLIGA